jgi:hypothetical protein
VSERKQHYVFSLVLVLLPLMLFAPAMVSNKIPFFMDILTQFFPIRGYAARLLHRGALPLYNPTYYCGVPLLANPQWGILYPPNLLFFLFPSGGMFTLMLVLHQIIGSLGVYLFVRSLTRDPVGALAAGLAFSFSGYVWAHYAFGAFLFAVAWVPFVFWSFEEYLARRRIQHVFLGGCFVGLQMLSGAPQIAFYAMMSYIVVCISRGVVLFVETRSSREALLPVVYLGSALVIGVGLSAPQWLSSFMFLRECERAGGLILPEIKVGTLTLAELWRAFTGGTGFPEDAETTVYFGVGGMVLFLFALVRKPKREMVPYVLLFFFTCLYSLRMAAPLLYRVMPGYSHFHDPKRILGVAVVIVAAMCGIAISYMRRAEWRDKKRELVRMLTIVILVSLTNGVVGKWTPQQADLALPKALGWITAPKGFPLWVFWLALGGSFILVALACVRFEQARKFLIATMIVILSLDLFIFALRRIDLKFINATDIFNNKSATANVLKAKKQMRYFTRDSSGHYSYDYARAWFGEWLLPNVGAYYGLEDFQGYDPVKPKRYAAYLAVLNEGYGMRFPRHFGIVTNPGSPLLQRANVGYEVSEKDSSGRQFLSVRPLEHSFPRLQSVSRFIEVRSFEDAVWRLRNEVQHQSSLIVVESRTGLGSIKNQFSQASILEERFSSNRVWARVETPGDYSWLVLRNGFSTAWRARVDGNPAPIYPVDVLFMGVLLRKGAHTVSFLYFPLELVVGGFIALATAIGMAVAYSFSPLEVASSTTRTKKSDR